MPRVAPRGASARVASRLAPIALALLAALPARSETIDYDALDEASKQAIKSACHGWIYRDAADWIAQWFDAVSPLCDAEEAARLRALHPQPAPVQATPLATANPDGTVTDFGGTGSWDPIRIECDRDYMCTTQRKRAAAAGRPVSMTEYGRIAQGCGGDYWCIERVFDDLPDIEIPPAAEGPQGSSGTGASDPPSDMTAIDALIALQNQESAAAPAVGAAPIAEAAPAGAVADASSGLYTASIEIAGSDPASMSVAAVYRNLSPVHLRLGPIELEMSCSDGSGGRAWAGGAAWVAPGEAAALRLGPDGLHGQSCPGGVAAYETTGRVRMLQAGISGYDQQSAICADGREIPIVVVMSDDSGAAYTFHSGAGAVFTASAAEYDARRVLAAVCGGRDSGSGGAMVAHVADGGAYLSRDYANLIRAWSEECRRSGAGCAAAYREWAQTRPQ